MGIKLINAMEKIVLDNIDFVVSELDCCSCEHCKSDIAAIVLNQLPPKYVVTEQGQLYSKLASYNKYDVVDLLTKITKASEIVKENPRHDLFN